MTIAGTAARGTLGTQHGRLKLFVTAKALRCRRERPDLFLSGGYDPIEVKGACAERFISFRRSFGGQEAVVVVPRLFGRRFGKKGSARPGHWAERHF